MWPGWVSDDDTLSRSRGRGVAQFYGQPPRAAPTTAPAQSSHHRFHPIAVEGRRRRLNAPPAELG